jgi:hypothetical protein
MAKGQYETDLLNLDARLHEIADTLLANPDYVKENKEVVSKLAAAGFVVTSAIDGLLQMEDGGLFDLFEEINLLDTVRSNTIEVIKTVIDALADEVLPATV